MDPNWTRPVLFDFQWSRMMTKCLLKRDESRYASMFINNLVTYICIYIYFFLCIYIYIYLYLYRIQYTAYIYIYMIMYIYILMYNIYLYIYIYAWIIYIYMHIYICECMYHTRCISPSSPSTVSVVHGGFASFVESGAELSCDQRMPLGTAGVGARLHQKHCRKISYRWDVQILSGYDCFMLLYKNWLLDRF